MNRISLLVLFLLTFSSILLGQNMMNKASDSDPKAKIILEDLRKEYETYKSLSVEFKLILNLPDQPEEIQSGWLKQSGEKFAVRISDQEIYCNGENLWVYLESNKEVQINDYDPNESENFLSPKDMLRIYEDGQYAYAITDEIVKEGQKLTLIEFKPLDRDSEYSKMRLSVDTKMKRAKDIKVFSKDGSNYTLVIEKLIPNKEFANSTFEFNTNKYPDVRVEDLRID